LVKPAKNLASISRQSDREAGKGAGPSCTFKRGADVKAVAQQYNASLAWVAIAVVPEEQRFSAYFGTIAQIEDAGERFSIPMRPEQAKRYECLSRLLEAFDELIRPEWSNGGYARRVS